MLQRHLTAACRAWLGSLGTVMKMLLLMCSLMYTCKVGSWSAVVNSTTRLVNSWLQT
jgi:hypothetical protein